MRTLKPVGVAGGRRDPFEGGVTSHGEEPGSENVTARTRAFEEIDAQVFSGPGRGATRAEAAASDRWGGSSPATGEAYRRMFELVVKHQAHPAPRLNQHDHVRNAAVASNGPTARASIDQNEPARGEDRRV